MSVPTKAVGIIGLKIEECLSGVSMHTLTIMYNPSAKPAPPEGMSLRGFFGVARNEAISENPWQSQLNNSRKFTSYKFKMEIATKTCLPLFKTLQSENLHVFSQ